MNRFLGPAGVQHNFLLFCFFCVILAKIGKVRLCVAAKVSCFLGSPQIGAAIIITGRRKVACQKGQ